MKRLRVHRRPGRPWRAPAATVALSLAACSPASEAEGEQVDASSVPHAPVPAATPTRSPGPADTPPRPPLARSYGYEGYASECVTCVHPALGTEMTVTASSELAEHPVGHAFDRDDTTAWCEAAAGLGVGESIRMDLDPPRDIAELEVLGGDFSSADRLYGGPRVKRIRVASNTGEVAAFELSEPSRRFEASMLTGMFPYLPLGWENVGTVTVTIEDLHAGDRSEAACVTHLALRAAPLAPVR